MASTHWSNATANWNTPANWTNGVPDFSKKAIFDFPGAYTVTINSAVQAGGILLQANDAILRQTAAGSIACNGAFTVAKGTAILDGANAFDRVVLSGGTTIAGNMNAFGISAIEFAGAHPLLTNDITLRLQNDLKASLGGTIAAMGGTKFTVGGSHFTWGDPAATLSFGNAGHDGTVVLHGTTATGTGAGIFINGGTLADDATGFGNILDSVGSVTLAAGATLKLNAASATVHFLGGEGNVVGGEGIVLTMHRSTGFGGVISGKMGLTSDGVVTLTGANTYTGPTIVKTTDFGDFFGGHLTITDGASLSTQSEIILQDSNLHLQHSDTYVLANLISGFGVIHQEGGGALALTSANTFAGDIRAINGIVEADNAHATGSARITLQGGTFLANASMTLNQFWSDYGGTLAVAAGKTVTTSTVNFYEVLDGTLTFGSSGNTGTVIWNTPSGSSSGGTNDIKIAFGTLRVGDDFFQLLDNDVVTGTVIGKHGRLDLDGHAASIFMLTGAGKIANGEAAADLTVDGGNFRGAFNGAIHPIVENAVHLKGGLGNFTAAIGVSDGAVLKLAGASAHDITFLNDSGGGASVAFTLNAIETGVVSGFGTSETFDFLGLHPDSASVEFDFNPNPATGGILTVDDGLHAQSIELAGDYQLVDFFASDDGHGGTTIVLQPLRPPPEPAFAHLHAHDIVHGHAYTNAHGEFI